MIESVEGQSYKDALKYANIILENKNDDVARVVARKMRDLIKDRVNIFAVPEMVKDILKINSNIITNEIYIEYINRYLNQKVLLFSAGDIKEIVKDYIERFNSNLVPIKIYNNYNIDANKKLKEVKNSYEMCLDGKELDSATTSSSSIRWTHRDNLSAFYRYDAENILEIVKTSNELKELLNSEELESCLEANAMDEKTLNDIIKLGEKYFIQKENEKARRARGCYIATSIYGSYDCPQVWTFRKFRDYKLSKNVIGRIFIRLYYFLSPKFIKLFGKTKWFNILFKKILDRFYNKLLLLGYNDAPYIDE